MENPQNYYGWRPSSGQELLLKAALLNGRPALLAWQEWSQTLDLELLDYPSRRLLPLLHHNLIVQHIDHPFTRQFKKLYIETWAKNQTLFSKISPLLQSLGEAGIDTLILKGAGFIVRYYKDFGLRPMNDFDFLVPTRQINDAIILLRQLGWTPAEKTSDKTLPMYLSTRHALLFLNPARYELDLHWHVLKECLATNADQDFWEGAIPIEINGVHTLGLDPADDLFHTCIHGVRWNDTPTIRWIADAVTILNSHASIDWDRLIQQAEKRQLAFPLKHALTYLKDQFAAPIPPHFLEALNRIPVSKREIEEYQVQTNRPGLFLYIPSMWIFYPRIARDTGRAAGIIGFIKYLQNFWKLDHLWQTPFYFTWRVFRRIILIFPGGKKLAGDTWEA
jgi:hypothetical protein